jgi:hypothetical protein
MTADEYISYDEAFELLCEKAGIRGRGVQVQRRTMHSYYYNPFADIGVTDDEWQRLRFIDNWLKEIGFTGQKYPRVEFERLAKWIGSKSVGESAAFATARQITLWADQCYRQPWFPPAQLTESALLECCDEPRIWLSAAANLMAFGRLELPKGLNEFEATTCRAQAAIALFDAAGKGIVHLIGSPDVEGGDRSDDIPPAYFDIPRNLGDADQSISTDLARLSEVCEGSSANWDAARHGRHQKWFNVRVETSRFVSWIISLVSGKPIVTPTGTETLPSAKETLREQSPIIHPGPGGAKMWRVKRGAKLPADRNAVLEAVKELWPDGGLYDRAECRNARINKWLENRIRRNVSARTIQRTLHDIAFS